MATASGSISFLGANRFQGWWNATTNEATGSRLTGAPGDTQPAIEDLFDSTSGYGGYNRATNLTAAIGDYWQVTGSGTTTVDGHTNWDLNDWIIYSGSYGGGSKKWTKLAVEDTIASIVIGDLSAIELWHLTGSADKHVLFITGTVDGSVMQSGSDGFEYDYSTGILALTGAAANGANGLITIKNTTDNGEFLTCLDSSGHESLRLGSTTGGGGVLTLYTNDDDTLGVLADGNLARIYLGESNAISDAIAVTIGSGSDGLTLRTNQRDITLSASVAVNIPDDVKLTFGKADDATIEYDEDGSDELRFAGAAATFEQDVTFDNDVTLGVAATDVTTVTGRLTASVGALIKDDQCLYFGDSEEASIKYQEASNDYLTIINTKAGKGVVISGSNIQLASQDYPQGYGLKMDSSGRIGIGVSGSIKDMLHIEDSIGGTGGTIELDRRDDAIEKGDPLGNIYFGATENGSDYDWPVNIRATALKDFVIDSDSPAALEFWLTPDGAASKTLTAHLHHGGLLLGSGNLPSSNFVSPQAPRGRLDVSGSAFLGTSSTDVHQITGTFNLNNSLTISGSDARMRLNYVDDTTWPNSAASDEEYANFGLTLKNDSTQLGAFTGIAMTVNPNRNEDAIGAAIVARSDSASDSIFDTDLAFATNTGADDALTERMRITHNGAVGIGLENPQDDLHIEKTTGAGLELSRHDADIATGDPLGTIYFAGTEDGSTYDIGARIRAQADSAWTVGSDSPTHINFDVNPDGSTTLATAMTIKPDSAISGSGNLEIVGTMKSTGDIATSGSITAGTSTVVIGPNNISGSGNLQMVGTIKATGDIATSGTLSAGTFSPANISGSGNLQMVGTMKSTGDIATSGSLYAPTIHGSPSSLGFKTHSISGSSNIHMVGTIKSIGDIGTSGSITAGNDISGSGYLRAGEIATSGTMYAGNYFGTPGDITLRTHSISGSGNTQIVGTIKSTGNIATSGSLTAATIGAFTAAGAIDFDSENMTNVDINSGYIDGTPIGVETPSSAKFTTISGSGNTQIVGTIKSIGNMETSGSVSGSSTFLCGSTLSVHGGATVRGDLTTQGSVTLGNTTSDDITINGKINANILPNSTHNLGSASDKFGSLFLQNISGSGNLQMVGTIKTTGDIATSGTLSAGTFSPANISGSGNLQMVGTMKSTGNIATSGSLTAATIGAFTAAGAIDFDNQDMTNVDIDSGDISGTNITVGSSKTLDVSAGTLTTSAAQKKAIVEGAASNVDFGAYEVRAQTFESDVSTGTAPLVVASTTNVANLNASSLGGATFAAPGAIGGTTPAAGSFTNISGSGTLQVVGAVTTTGDIATSGSFTSPNTLKLNSTAGDISFEADGTAQLAIDMDGTAGDVVIQLKVDDDELVFKSYDGAECAVIRNANGAGGFAGKKYVVSMNSALMLSGSGGFSASALPYMGAVIAATAPDGGSYSVTLPTTAGNAANIGPMFGYNLRIVLAAFANAGNKGDITIVRGDTVGSTPGGDCDAIVGCIASCAADSNAAAGITLSSHVITINGASVTVGDYIDLVCINSSTGASVWHVSGICAT